MTKWPLNRTELGTYRDRPRMPKIVRIYHFLHVGEERGGERTPLRGGHIVESLQFAAHFAVPREIHEGGDELLPHGRIDGADVAVEVHFEEELGGFDGLSEGGGGLGVGGERDGDDGVDIGGEMGSEGEIEANEVGEIGENGLEDEGGEGERGEGEKSEDRSVLKVREREKEREYAVIEEGEKRVIGSGLNRFELQWNLGRVVIRHEMIDKHKQPV